MELSHPDSHLAKILKEQRVLPIVGGMTDSKKAVDLAQVLFEAGVKVMEFPVRGQDPEAVLRSISEVRNKVPALVMGAGSITTPEEWERALDFGAQFGVSPGMSPQLRGAVERMRHPFIPGFQTVSEGMALQEGGFQLLKWFPAQSSGGVETLRQILPTFLRGETGVVPTGGITYTLTPDYLNAPGVTAVGASWVTPAKAIQQGDWAEVRSLVEAAKRLAGQNPVR